MEVKSINDRPKRMLIREQAAAPGPVAEAPKVATEAIPEPPRRQLLTKFTTEKVVGITPFQNRLYVATESGVYVETPDGYFKRLSFEKIEEEDE